MDCKEEACLDCTKQCSLLRGKKKDPVPNVTSFFKVMMGDKFSDILVLPPKFASTVLDLVDKKTYLEDLSGRQWKVTVSKLNGSLAFCEGWQAFALDHCLEIGDFVVFHCIMGSHFITQIYDRTSCEKPTSSENMQQKKVTRRKGSTVSKDCPSRKTVKRSINELVSSTSVLPGSEIGLINSQDSSTVVKKVPRTIENTLNRETSKGKLKSVSKAAYVEKPSNMVGGDFGVKQEEHRSSVFDLTNLKFGAHGRKTVIAGDEKSPCDADKPLLPQTEAVATNEDTVAEKVRGKGVVSDASNFQRSEKNMDSDMTKKIISRHDRDSCDNKVSGELLIKSSKEPGENGKDISDLGNEGIKERQTAETKSKSNKHSKKALELMKGLQHRGLNPTDELYKAVKTEVTDSTGSPLPIAAPVCCSAITVHQSFLELPAGFASLSNRGKTKTDRKVVYLRDPDMRLWPLLFHERPDLKVLTSGWEDFARANNIHPGDECVFMLENEVEGIYAVSILRKKD